MIRGWIDFLLNLSWRLTRSQPTTSRQKSGPCGGKQTTPWPPRRLPTAVRRSGRGSTEALTDILVESSNRLLPLPKAGMPGLPFSISWGLSGIYQRHQRNPSARTTPFWRVVWPWTHLPAAETIWPGCSRVPGCPSHQSPPSPYTGRH